LEKRGNDVKKLFFVLVVSGPLKGHKYFVASDAKVLIGRSDEANIRIGYDDFCSRRHALLSWENNLFFVEDLKSTNGTFVNGNRIEGKAELHNGDVIGLGDTELLVGVKDYPEGKNIDPDEDIKYED
jgi:pSer/pThr/pTyr-binding forkhead associated (FHA) protein